MPDVDIVPVVALPPVTPFTSQVTAVPDNPDTVAPNVRDEETGTVALVADSVIEAADAVSGMSIAIAAIPADAA